MNMQVLMRMLQMLMGQPNLQQGGGLGRPVAGFDPRQHMQNALHAEQQANTPEMQKLMAEQQRRSAEARQQRGIPANSQVFISGVDDWASKQPGYIDARSFMSHGTGGMNGPMAQQGRAIANQWADNPREYQNSLGNQQFTSEGFRTGGPDYGGGQYAPYGVGQDATDNFRQIQSRNLNPQLQAQMNQMLNNGRQMQQQMTPQNPFASLFMNQNQMPAFLGGQNTQMPIWGQGPQNRQQPNLFSSFGFRR